jgi:hypothetical protein
VSEDGNGAGSGGAKGNGGKRPRGKDMDARVSIQLDPRTALKALMAVDPAEVNGKRNGKRQPKKKPAKS